MIKNVSDKYPLYANKTGRYELINHLCHTVYHDDRKRSLLVVIIKQKRLLL